MKKQTQKIPTIRKQYVQTIFDGLKTQFDETLKYQLEDQIDKNQTLKSVYEDSFNAQNSIIRFMSNQLKCRAKGFKEFDGFDGYDDDGLYESQQYCNWNLSMNCMLPIIEIHYFIEKLKQLSIINESDYKKQQKLEIIADLTHKLQQTNKLYQTLQLKNNKLVKKLLQLQKSSLPLQMQTQIQKYLTEQLVQKQLQNIIVKKQQELQRQEINLLKLQLQQKQRVIKELEIVNRSNCKYKCLYEELTISWEEMRKDYQKQKEELVSEVRKMNAKIEDLQQGLRKCSSELEDLTKINLKIGKQKQESEELVRILQRQLDAVLKAVKSGQKQNRKVIRRISGKQGIQGIDSMKGLSGKDIKDLMGLEELCQIFNDRNKNINKCTKDDNYKDKLNPSKQNIQNNLHTSKQKLTQNNSTHQTFHTQQRHPYEEQDQESDHSSDILKNQATLQKITQKASQYNSQSLIFFQSGIDINVSGKNNHVMLMSSCQNSLHNSLTNSVSNSCKNITHYNQTNDNNSNDNKNKNKNYGQFQQNLKKQIDRILMHGEVELQIQEQEQEQQQQNEQKQEQQQYGQEDQEQQAVLINISYLFNEESQSNNEGGDENVCGFLGEQGQKGKQLLCLKNSGRKIDDESQSINSDEDDKNSSCQTQKIISKLEIPQLQQKANRKSQVILRRSTEITSTIITQLLQTQTLSTHHLQALHTKITQLQKLLNSQEAHYNNIIICQENKIQEQTSKIQQLEQQRILLQIAKNNLLNRFKQKDEEYGELGELYRRVKGKLEIQGERVKNLEDQLQEMSREKQKIYEEKLYNIRLLQNANLSNKQLLQNISDLSTKLQEQNLQISTYQSTLQQTQVQLTHLHQNLQQSQQNLTEQTHQFKNLQSSIDLLNQKITKSEQKTITTERLCEDYRLQLQKLRHEKKILEKTNGDLRYVNGIYWKDIINVKEILGNTGSNVRESDITEMAEEKETKNTNINHNQQNSRLKTNSLVDKFSMNGQLLGHRPRVISEIVLNMNNDSSSNFYLQKQKKNFISAFHKSSMNSQTDGKNKVRQYMYKTSNSFSNSFTTTSKFTHNTHNAYNTCHTQRNHYTHHPHHASTHFKNKLSNKQKQNTNTNMYMNVNSKYSRFYTADDSECPVTELMRKKYQL